MANENNLFSQWDKQFDTEGLQKDIADAAENGGNFKEVPHGTYEFSVEKMELKATKKYRKPMVSIWLKVVSKGDYKGSMVFMNQVITEGFQIHIVNELLRGLTAHCSNCPVIEFKTYSQYAGLLMDIHELIGDSYEYAIDYGKTDNGFDTFKVKEIFDLEDPELPY